MSNLRCPGCGGALSRRAGGGEVAYECGDCGGTMHGLAPFERSLPEGVGARVWVAAEDGGAGPPCPLCLRPTRRPTADPAALEGLLVCRTCAQVWVPARSGPVAAVDHERCPSCGAPWSPDAKGRCRYCRCQLAAPAPVLITIEAN